MKCIVIFSKAPIPGEVKTRLSPVIDIHGAALFHEAFVNDTVAALNGLDEADLWIACHPSGCHPFFADMRNRFDLSLFDQGEGDLGDRMKRGLEFLRSKGYEKIVVLGSDSPTLPADVVSDAFARLEDSRVVVGPSLDGGYYLLGVSGDLPDIFSGVSWGGETVFNETMGHIKKNALGYSLLPFWYDVDTIRELRFLAIHLSSLPDGTCSATRGVMERFREKIYCPSGPEQLPM